MKTSTGSGTPRSMCLPSESIGVVQTSLNSAEAQTGTPKLLGQALQTGGAVDGGADDREVEPVLGADIAERHRADMKADAEAHGVVADGRARLVGRVDVVDQPAAPR